MRGRTPARWAALTMLLVPLLAGCGGEADPNADDPSAPTLSLDVSGTAAQASASPTRSPTGSPTRSPTGSPSPAPSSIDSVCCDVVREVRPGGIDLVAVAADPQSGIRAVEIWTHGERTACVRADGTGAVTGPGLGATAAQTRSDADGIPALAPDRLVARHRLTIAARRAGCVTYTYEVTAYATASNWAGQSVATKRFSLRYAYP